MNSRFKFRAWYKDAKYMLTNIRLPVGDGTIYGWFNDRNGLRTSDYFNSDDCVIMQCTGLTDKNGGDIYEGDIIRDVTDDYDPPIEFEVEWNDDPERLRFEFATVSGDFDFGDSFSFDHILVVGNVYEGTKMDGGDESEAANEK